MFIVNWTSSIPLLLMSWLLASPGYQQPWYRLCRIKESLPSTRKDFNYLLDLRIEKRLKMQMYLYVDGLVQERRNSIANTLELHLSCPNLSMYPKINSAQGVMRLLLTWCARYVIWCLRRCWLDGRSLRLRLCEDIVSSVRFLMRSAGLSWSSAFTSMMLISSRPRLFLPWILKNWIKITSQIQG